MGSQDELKPCPRCGGNLFVERDVYGWYRSCIQCGAVYNLSRPEVARRAAPQKVLTAVK